MDQQGPRQPPVTVVVPSKDRWQLLRQTLTSILSQRGVEVQVIVVDDGSAEPYAPGLAALDDPRVRVVRTVGVGLSAARNAGLAQSQTRWTAFCDDDDLWSPDKLRAQMTVLADHPDAEWCVCGSVSFDNQGELFDWTRASAGPALYRRLLAANVVPGGGSGVVLLTDRLRGIGGFDPKFVYSEDWDAWLRLAKIAKSVAVDRPLVAYRVHVNSMTYTGSPFPALERMEHLYDRERIAAGVEFDWAGVHYQVGLRAAARNERARAFRHLWRSAKLGHSMKRRVLAWITLVRPQWAYTRNRSGAELVPSDWPAEVSQWLLPLLGLPVTDEKPRIPIPISSPTHCSRQLAEQRPERHPADAKTPPTEHVRGPMRS